MTEAAPLETGAGLTPSQTVGPYLHIGLVWSDGPYAVPEGTPGAFWLTGVVRDGEGDPVGDALVETWQADPAGRFDHPDDPRGAAPSDVPGFRGFARCATDADGRYRILTVKPGRLPAADDSADGADGWEAPHLDVSVLGRGMLDRVVTRVYFPDEVDANAADPVLATVPADRRSTLVAVEAPGGELHFDVRVQGAGETVFFDL